MDEHTREEWRAIAGFEGLYEVSSHGRVRSLPRWTPVRGGGRQLRRGRILKPFNHDGYQQIALTSQDGAKLHTQVQRVVAQTFLGPRPSALHVVAHWNGDPTDNHLENLRWATYAENAEDMRRHGNMLIGSQKPTAKLNEAQVAIIKSQLAAGISLRSLAKSFNVSETTIYDINVGRKWRHVSVA